MPENVEKLAVLSKIGQKFNDAGVTWAVGASLMLYLNHKTDTFHDIDIMTTCQDAPRAKNILLQMGTLAAPKPNETYKTKCFWAFTVEAVDIDLMAGMIIARDGVDYDCSLQPETITGCALVNGVRIPLHAMEEWRRYYALMGRTEKVRMIDG